LGGPLEPVSPLVGDHDAQAEWLVLGHRTHAIQTDLLVRRISPLDTRDTLRVSRSAKMWRSPRDPPSAE